MNIPKFLKAEFRRWTVAAKAPRNTRLDCRVIRAGSSRDRRAIVARRTAKILYTEGVQAHWIETTVGEHGELVLEGLPFEPGQPVEVLVMSKTTGSRAGGRSLRDSVIEFHEPLEPVASEDWDALQ